MLNAIASCWKVVLPHALTPPPSPTRQQALPVTPVWLLVWAAPPVLAWGGTIPGVGTWPGPKQWERHCNTELQQMGGNHIWYSVYETSRPVSSRCCHKMWPTSTTVVHRLKPLYLLSPLLMSRFEPRLHMLQLFTAGTQDWIAVVTRTHLEAAVSTHALFCNVIRCYVTLSVDLPHTLYTATW